MLRHRQPQRPQQNGVDHRRFARRYLGVGNSVSAASQKIGENLAGYYKKKSTAKNKLRKISSLGSRAELKIASSEGAISQRVIILICHSEEHSDEESAFSDPKNREKHKADASLSFSMTDWKFCVLCVLCR